MTAWLGGGNQRRWRAITLLSGPPPLERGTCGQTELFDGVNGNSELQKNKP
jgi:hypothetical protein